jgi:4-amino-4-deoxy-L-arabinose transferase-like glycosyltransferase
MAPRVQSDLNIGSCIISMAMEIPRLCRDRLLKVNTDPHLTDQTEPRGISHGLRMANGPFITRARMSVICLLVLGLAMRLIWLGDPFARTHSWNEGHYAMTVRNFERFGPWTQMNDLGVEEGLTPLVPLIMYPTAWMSGWQPWGFRLPLALLGVAALGVFLMLAHRRWGIPWEASLAGTAIAATAPGIVYYARNVQLDGAATAFLLASLCLLSSPRRALRPWGWALWILCVLAKSSFAVFAPAVLLARMSARPGDMRSPAVWLRSCALVALGPMPILAWICWNWISSPEEVSLFVLRPGERTPAAISAALQRTPDFFLRQFGGPGLVLACLGLVALLMRRGLHSPRRWLSPTLLAICWGVFLFTHPRAYASNRYYIYPSLFVLCLLGGVGLHTLSHLIARSLRWSPQAVLAALCALLMCVNVVLYFDHYGEWRLRGPALHAALTGADPYEGARRAAEMVSFPGTILVDQPATMFYAGGDPGRVRCAYGDVARAFDPERDAAVVLNTHDFEPLEENEFTDRLRSLGWHEIAPRVWTATSDEGTGDEM